MDLVDEPARQEVGEVVEHEHPVVLLERVRLVEDLGPYAELPVIGDEAG